MRHNSFQKIYASYIAPDPEMDVLWMDLKADPYGSVIKFWNGGIGKYELISSDASTIGKHVIYADDVELPVRSIINFKGFDISENQPGDQLIISVDNKEDAGTAQSIIDYHESEFNHSDIEHPNRAALNSVSGVNTGDQDLSGLASKSELSGALLLKVDKEAGKQLSTEDYTSQEKVKLAGISENANNYTLPSDVVQDANYVHTDNNFTDSLLVTLSNQSGVNTGDQDLSGLVEKKANHSLVSDLEIEKLEGIEENANNYTHPETHPSSILDVVDEVNGNVNKFFNERGEMVAVATSSIGVTGSQLYASTVDSDVAGYKSLVGTPQPLETEIALTAKSSAGIVWGDKYLSAPFTEAITIPSTAYGFDYWRKVSASNGTSRKHLRVFLYRAGVETNISAPLTSPDIDDTEFTERQISYIFPELALLAGDRIGIQEGFSTTHANNVTLTYIVGDGRGWFMRLPLPLKHENLTDKNSEAAFQHVDTTTIKETLDESDKVALYDSVTGKVVLTKKSNIDESFKKLAVRRGAVFNEATGFYELNGLTDITEEQMMDIYNYTSQMVNTINQGEVFRGLPIKTAFERNSGDGGSSGLILTNAYRDSAIIVYKSNSIIYHSECTAMFSGCAFLSKVFNLRMTATSSVKYTNMFKDCASLTSCLLRELKTSISLQWSPLLSLESLQYIIKYRGNGTTQITITVHPTVFAKLTDNVNYPTWYAVAQDALTKFITFATA